jgi:hypothetical protein
VNESQFRSDAVVDQVRTAIVSSWGQLQAAHKEVAASGTQVTAAKIALTGVREAAKLGDRTNYDVLLTEQDLNDALISEITARRDLVVASYALALAIGGLDYVAPEDLPRPVVAAAVREEVQDDELLPPIIMQTESPPPPMKAGGPKPTQIFLRRSRTD